MINIIYLKSYSRYQIIYLIDAQFNDLFSKFDYLFNF